MQSRTTRTRAASAAPSSPAKASSSSTRPPSSATFAPRLGSAVPATPRSAGRAGRPGERISYQSLNGSPIFGVVGPDRVVQPDASETGEFADALEGTEGVSGLGGSDPDFDLPDEAAYTAEVLAAAEAQRGAASSSSAGSGSGSSSTTIIGRKGKGARASITLGATGRELDLATASPEDLEGCSPETRKKAREAKLKWLEEQRARWGI